ncbi:MAG TPA: nuclear transport factor 2 family protein [Allosphingosinicella sp.]|jgi:hypothetical protein
MLPTLLAALLLGAAPTPAAAPDPLEAQLIALEKESWAAWQGQDVAFWQRFLSDDHVELNAFVGAVGKKEVIAGIAGRQCRVASWKVDGFTYRRFDASTALLVYRAEQDTKCGAFVVPSPVWVTSLYQKRGGRWLNLLYGHTPIPPRPKPAG